MTVERHQLQLGVSGEDCATEVQPLGVSLMIDPIGRIGNG